MPTNRIDLEMRFLQWNDRQRNQQCFDIQLRKQKEKENSNQKKKQG